MPTISDVFDIRANLVYQMLVMFTSDEKFYALKNGIKDVYVTKTV